MAMRSFSLAGLESLSILLLVALVTLLIIGSTYGALGPLAGKVLARLLSPPLNTYLSWRHVVYSVDGHSKLPSLPYEWPNGQGDVAKFLAGKENSERWRQIYGSVYRLWSGANPEVVVADPDDIRTIFKDSHRHAKAPGNNAGRLMHELLGQCLGLINHKEWSAVHSAVEGPFQAQKAPSYLPLILNEVQSHMRASRAHPTCNLAHGRLDPVADLKFVPFWIIASIIYGPLDDQSRRELKDLIPLRERLWSRMLQGGTVRFGWSRFLPLTANRELAEWKQRWSAFNARMAQREPDGEAQPPVASMYAAFTHGTITEEQLLQTIDEMLFANLDVTMGGISWNFVFLAAHPEVQRELRAEVLAACPEILNTYKSDHTAASAEKYLLSDSTLLHACVLESARLRPLAAFSVPQAAPTERVVGASTDSKPSNTHGTSPGGYRVPGGTSFIIDTHSLNMRHPFWGASAEERTEYRPQRFLELSRPEYRYRYWRFGFGPRQCLGKYVADAMIKALVACVVAQHDLGMLDEDEQAGWERDSESWIMHPAVVLRCERREDGKGE